MSDVCNILSAIGEANRALEAEPGYKARISGLEAQSVRDGEKIATYELTIHSLREQIDQLNAQVRTLTEARDDAQFRFLELEDRCSAVIAALGPFAEKVNALLPPKPAPQPVTEAPATEQPPTAVEPVPVPPSITQPYVDKLYADWPRYVSKADWIAGGGNDFSYEWHGEPHVVPYNYDRPPFLANGNRDMWRA